MYNKLFIQKNKRLMVILFGATALLMIPLIAMQFSKEVSWSGFDFLVMGILLFGTGLTCEGILRKFKTIWQRIIFCGIAFVIFFLIWVELAVGIFNSPIAGG